MSRLLSIFTVCIATIFIIQGCASFRNITAKEIRTDEYFHKTYETKKKIKEIETSLYTYSKECRQIPLLSIDNNNNKEAFITISQMGWTDWSVIVVMDFYENDDATIIKTYSYYSNPYDIIKKIINAIENPHYCD